MQNPLVFLALILIGALASARPDHNLEVSLNQIDLLPTQFLIQMKITNVGEIPIQLLSWNTPFDGIKNNIFSVVDQNGESAQYLGIIMKRGPPPPSAFEIIYSNETKSIIFDLSESYSLTSEMTYTVTYNGYVHWSIGTSLVIVHPTPTDPETYRFVPFEKLNMGPLSSEPITVHIKASYQLHPPPVSRQNDSSSHHVGVNYPSCSSTQQTQVTSAITTAKSMATTALNYLSASSCDSYFVTWFGKYTGSSRWSMIQQNFNRINTKLNSMVFNVACGGSSCTSDTFAYVYPYDSSFTITVCGAFWSASPSITYDSKPGTLIHEMSHFSAIAGTQDHTYGTSSAKDLAARQPDKAVNNADNHEYFAESSPRC